MEVLEAIARGVRNGTLPVEKAGREVMRVVYENHAFFGLYALTQDQLHDFMLFHFNKFFTVFAAFQPERGSFTSFLYSTIATSLTSWQRKNARSFAAEESMSLTTELTYEEESCKYERAEHLLVCASDPAESHSAEEVQEFRRTYRPATYRHCRRRTVRIPAGSFYSTRMDTLRRSASLILALKSSYYMNDDLIEKVSVLTDYPADLLQGMVEQVKDSLRHKIQRREACVKCRDNAWYFHRKYLLETQRLDDGSARAEDIRRKLRKHTLTWQNRNERLRLDSYRAVPSNRLIGKLLGMSDRHVYWVIKKAREHMDTISLKSYYERHEDLSGKRKPGQAARGIGAVS